MKWIVVILVLIILGLQYRLWFGEGSLEQIAELEREIEKQKIENATLQERNDLLLSQIRELKEGTEGLEEKARQDMGMVKEGETFYYITETPAKNNPPAKKP
jgi:cell division protein FtsB